MRFLRLKPLILIALVGIAASHARAGETRSSDFENFTNFVQGKDDACTNPGLRCDKLQSMDSKSFMDELSKSSENEAAKEGSIGLCARGVAYAVTGLCSGKPSGLCGNASGLGKCLSKLGFRQCAFTPENRKQMQALKIKGAIYDYSGGPQGDGHVEIYTDHGWCSDHCGQDAMQSTERVPFGIYVPQGFQPLPGMECEPAKAGGR